MPAATLATVLHYVRQVGTLQAARDLSDVELLGRFCTQRDEAAFTLLVQRHGPMVLGVCRRLLGDLHDAEDAFQATFLVLSCKATSIHRQGSLAAWLHGVAQRVAGKARAKARRRHEQERRSAVKAHTEPIDEQTWEELRKVLDEELSQLPEKYRAPVLLCYFEGKTNEQAARELGCPKSSLSWRLGRAGELLRERLTRRGITLSAGTIATVLMERTATAGLPALLVISTVKAATKFAAGGAAAVSAEVAALTKGALKTMFLTKIKIAMVSLFVTGVIAGGGVLVTHRALAGNGGAGTQPQTPPDPVPAQVEFAKAYQEKLVKAFDELLQHASEAQSLQGAWEGQSAEQDGKALPQDQVKKMRVVIKGDRMILVPGGEFTPLAIKVDAAKSPKVLHVTPTEGKDKTTPMIYELDRKEDTLKLCFDTKEGKKLPTEFATKPGSGLILLHFKHEPRPPKPQGEGGNVLPQERPIPERGEVGEGGAGGVGKPPLPMQERPDPDLPALGVQFRLDVESGKTVVAAVIEKGPADKAGIKEGDRLLKVSDQEVDRPESVVKAVRKHKTGDKVKVVLQRDNQEKTVEVTLAKWSDVLENQKAPPPPPEKPNPAPNPGVAPPEIPNPFRNRGVVPPLKGRGNDPLHNKEPAQKPDPAPNPLAVPQEKLKSAVGESLGPTGSVGAQPAAGQLPHTFRR